MSAHNPSKYNAIQSVYDDPIDQQFFDDYGFVYCPSPDCQVHLDNGMSIHDPFEEKRFHHKKYVYCCLGCCEEFGPLIDKGPFVQRVKKKGKAHPKNMSLRALVIAYLNEFGLCIVHGQRPVSDLVNEIAMEFDISKANARYYVSRVWVGPESK
jgi:hypothetical protein|tara:strand:+ start:173 stop:634 length:462 start_codon:yes stop_codon:yes gene_type:complete